MIMKANKQIGFIYKNNESIDKILKDDDVVFERGFLREKTSTTLPITFGGVGKDLKDYKIYGNTYQNSTSGKNLFDINNVTSVDNGSISDNLITSDTITSSSVQNIRPRFSTPFPFKVGTYYISADIRRKSGTGELNKFNDGFTDYTKVIFPNLTDEFQRYVVSHQYNSPTSYADGRLLFQVAANSNQLVLEIKNIMVSTSDDYNFEPYTNGPAPNPTFEEKIVSCGDRTKNLCGELEQGGYNETTGAKSTSSNYRNKEPIKVLPNTNYIFSINDVGQALNVFEYKSDGTYIGRIGGGVIPANSYFTTSSETAYINIFRGTSAGIEKWQIEQNDNVTSYEPYGYKIPVNVRSDNLFDVNWYFDNCVTHNCSKELIENSIKISFTAGADAYIGEARNSSVGTTPAIQNIAIAVKNNTQYTFIASSLPRCYITYMDKNYDILNSSYIRFDSSYTKSSYTFTTPENCKYVAFRMGIQDNEYTEWTFGDIQLVEGSTVPLKYIPYYNKTTNIYLDEPLRKTKDGTYVDYIDFINQKVVRRIKETLLDDNITWITSRFANEKRIYTSSSNIDSNMRAVTSNSQVGYLLSNQYKTEKLENILALSVRYGIGISSTSYFSILNQDYASATDFLQALHDNPIVLDYVLRTPTEESITLPNIPTLDENNTLNIETEITPSQVYIKYKSNS